MKIKKKFIESITSDVSFNQDYSSIKDKINLDYLEKSTITMSKRLKYALVLSILLVFLLSFSIIILNGKNKVSYIDSNIILYDNDKEFVDAHDFIFVAKVEKLQYVKGYDGTGTDIPYSFYSYSNPVYLKKTSQTINDNLLCFYGGKNKIFGTELLRTNSVMLEEGSYYLFFVNQKNGSTNKRINDEDFIIHSNIQKIKLDSFDYTKSLISQNKIIQPLINRYLNIINKNININMLNTPTFLDKEVLVNAHDYMAIIYIEGPSYEILNDSFKSEYMSSTLNQSAEIVSSIYEINVLDYLKGTASYISNRLYCYNTNYWNEVVKPADSINVLNKGDVYLMIANINETIEDNLRIENGDFVVMRNYQLIKLENYDIEKNYKKQEQNILDIINNYYNVN